MFANQSKLELLKSVFLYLPSHRSLQNIANQTYNYVAKNIIRLIVQSQTCLGKFYAMLLVFMVLVKSEKNQINMSLLKTSDYFSLISSVSLNVFNETLVILEATMCKHLFSCINDYPW